MILKAGSAVLLALVFQAAAAAASPQACVEGLWPTAKSAGVTRATFDRAFQGFTPDPEVVEAANFQPEYVKPIGEYIDRAVSDKRVETGKQKLIENQALLGSLARAEPTAAVVPLPFAVEHFRAPQSHLARTLASSTLLALSLLLAAATCCSISVGCRG